jgi:hypothetical protein
MSKLTKIQEFILFCLETYKTRYKLQGNEVFNLFCKYNVFNFLEDGYEVLHTQSLDYVVSEIYELIENKDETISR